MILDNGYHRGLPLRYLCRPLALPRPGAVFFALILFVLERPIENVRDEDIQIVEQAALELGGHSGPLLFRHLGQLPVLMKGVEIMQHKLCPLGALKK